MLSARQHAFAAALLDPERPLPAGVKGRGGAPAAKRFAVYRNNVVAGLVGALRTRFPVLQAVLGDECFAATAQVFATTHPPRSPLMMFYGDDLAGFLAGFPPLAEYRYLADLARLEAARTHAYHAADAAPIDPQRLQGLHPDMLFGLRLCLHPSLRLVRSPHPIVSIWAMNSGEAPLAPIEGRAGEDALVMRADLTVTVRRLPAGSATFVQGLAAQETLGRAAGAALMEVADFDLAASLAILIGSGAIIGAETDAQEHPS